MMTPPPLLFADSYLTEKLSALAQHARRRLADWPADDLLAMHEVDVVANLLDTASIECPTLLRADAYLLDPAEADLNFREFGKIVSRRITRFTLVVPFYGDREIFTWQPSWSTFNTTRAEVSGAELRLFSCLASGDPSSVKTDFDAQLDEIERFLDRSRNEIQQRQYALEAQIPRLVSDRRAKLLADRAAHASIGFPIKRQPDTSAYSVPLRRRQVLPSAVATKRAPTHRFEPEPKLSGQDYEAALAVLQNVRSALERSPSTTRQLGEDQIRDILLASLNAQFEGEAVGEVFNGAGKTDILIRVNDRNIFIGECKIWKGPQTVADALDQLLGYLVWRDTKAALLLFIREADVSTVTAKAVAKVGGHPSYKRRGKNWTEGRYDFVLRTPGDPSQEIHLALLPFLIGPKN